MSTERLTVTAAASVMAEATPVARRRNRRFFSAGSAILLTLFVCFLILEVGLRLSGRYNFGNSEGYFAHGGISYVLKKNVTKEVIWPSMSFTVHTSDLGFRAKQPGPQNIGKRPYCVFLGASDVFGNGLNYEDTFVGIFGERISRHGLDVVNLGIAGHHLIEQTELFRQFLARVPTPPKEVLVVFNPLFIGGYDDIHATVTVRRGDLFEQENWRMALTRKLLANTSAIYCFFRDSIRHLQHKYSSGGEEFALSFYIERFSAKHRIHQPEVTQGFLAELKKLDELIRKAGATPIHIYCPPGGTFLLNDLVAKGKLEKGLVDTAYFADIVRNHAQAEGIRFIDLTRPVQAHYDQGEKITFERDGHYNGPTSKLVGEYLYEQLKPASPANL
jgi:hypothetical protein